jgi:hypothetical protein
MEVKKDSYDGISCRIHILAFFSVSRVFPILCYLLTVGGFRPANRSSAFGYVLVEGN